MQTAIAVNYITFLQVIIPIQEVLYLLSTSTFHILNGLVRMTDEKRQKLLELSEPVLPEAMEQSSTLHPENYNFHTWWEIVEAEKLVEVFRKKSGFSLRS